jgi:hypothetical protein
LLRALGWEPGHELELDTTNGMIAIASVPVGRHRVDDRGALALPTAARRMCGITIGPPVVLVAAMHEQISASDIESMQHRMAATARSRRNSHHAGEP